MALKFSCGSCGRKFAAKDDQGGKSGKCPGCGTTLVVPVVGAWYPDKSPAAEQAKEGDGKATPIADERLDIPGLQARPDDEMAIRFNCSACGKRLKVKDEYAGRRSKCPGCGVGVVVPMEGTWEEDDSPGASSPAAPPPIPVAPAVPAVLTQIRTSEDYDDEPRPWKPSKAGVPDLLKTNQILLAAVGAGALILIVAFAFVALRTSGRGPIQEAASTEHAKGPAPADTVVTEDRKKIRPEDMPGAAHLWILLYIQDTLKSQPKTESVRVDDVEVRPIHDDRKIEWLWEATATVSLAVQSDTPGQAATRMPMTWRVVFQFTPYWYARECWREVVEMKFGQKYRKHFGFSEWNSRFRSEIRSRWTRDFRAWDAEMRRRGESDADRIRYLQDLKMGTAQTLGLSAEELQEIVEATD